MAKKQNKYTPLFAEENDFQVESTLVSLTSVHHNFIDIIDQAPSNLISNNRKQNAKTLINTAKLILLAYSTDGSRGMLDTKSQRRVLEMVSQVVSGKREAVQFQLTRDCEGIKEMYSNEVFKIESK